MLCLRCFCMLTLALVHTEQGSLSSPFPVSFQGAAVLKHHLHGLIYMLPNICTHFGIISKRGQPALVRFGHFNLSCKDMYPRSGHTVLHALQVEQKNPLGPSCAGAQEQQGQSSTQTTEVVSSLFRRTLPQKNLLNFCAM